MLVLRAKKASTRALEKESPRLENGFGQRERGSNRGVERGGEGKGEGVCDLRASCCEVKASTTLTPRVDVSFWRIVNAKDMIDVCR